MASAISSTGLDKVRESLAKDTAINEVDGLCMRLRTAVDRASTPKELKSIQALVRNSKTCLDNILASKNDFGEWGERQTAQTK